MSEAPEIFKTIKDARYTPAIVGILIFGLLLLVYKDLPDINFKEKFIPAVAVFALGTTILSQVQSNSSYAAHNRQKALQKPDDKDTPVEGIQGGLLHAINASFIICF